MLMAIDSPHQSPTLVGLQAANTSCAGVEAPETQEMGRKKFLQQIRSRSENFSENSEPEDPIALAIAAKERRHCEFLVLCSFYRIYMPQTLLSRSRRNHSGLLKACCAT